MNLANIQYYEILQDFHIVRAVKIILGVLIISVFCIMSDGAVNNLVNAQSDDDDSSRDEEDDDDSSSEENNP
ncbi:MAG: hypothetical protein WBX81_03895, partial [Nitrososphaeraceae archaeon]